MTAMARPNPLIPGFNPDPSCCFADGAYYTVTSTFEYLPALPVYRSTDLTHWSHIGNVATREAQVGLAQTPSGLGVFAPTIRYRNGVFYVIVSVMGSARGCVLFTAADPAGPWSEGIEIPGVRGIDPDLAWDENGVAHVTFSGLDLEAGVQEGIQQVRVDLSTGECLEAPRTLWSGTGLSAPEAPHLHRRGDYWYLFIAEGGTARGHSVSVARSRAIAGPYVSAPGNPVLSASGTDRRVVGTGHADLVTNPEGDDVLLLLGTRPVDVAAAFSPLGRETYWTTVEWADGWPEVAPVELAPAEADVEEHFDLRRLSPVDPGWLAVGQEPEGLVSVTPDGWVLEGREGGVEAFRPAFIGRRQRHIRCKFTVEVDASAGTGGLALRFHEGAALQVTASAEDGGNRVEAAVILPSLRPCWKTELPPGLVILELEIQEQAPGDHPWASGPDGIVVSARSADGGPRVILAELDGRYWSVEVAAPFTGRVVGMVASEGQVCFGRFHYFGHGLS